METVVSIPTIIIRPENAIRVSHAHSYSNQVDVVLCTLKMIDV